MQKWFLLPKIRGRILFTTTSSQDIIRANASQLAQTWSHWSGHSQFFFFFFFFISWLIDYLCCERFRTDVKILLVFLYQCNTRTLLWKLSFILYLQGYLYYVNVREFVHGNNTELKVNKNTSNIHPSLVNRAF